MTGLGLVDWFCRLGGWDGRAPLRAGNDVNFLGDSYPKMQIAGNVAIVPISGPLMSRPSFIERGLGAMGYDEIEGMLDTAVASGCKGIVLAVNSPGGAVGGMFELCEKIDGIAQTMPVCAVTDGVMG
jgi:ClpP class serine protease